MQIPLHARWRWVWIETRSAKKLLHSQLHPQCFHTQWKTKGELGVYWTGAQIQRRMSKVTNFYKWSLWNTFRGCCCWSTPLHCMKSTLVPLTSQLHYHWISKNLIWSSSAVDEVIVQVFVIAEVLPEEKSTWSIPSPPQVEVVRMQVTLG